MDLSNEMLMLIASVMVIGLSTLFVLAKKDNASAEAMKDMGDLLDNESEWDTKEKEQTKPPSPAPKQGQKESKESTEPKEDLKNVFDVKQAPPKTGEEGKKEKAKDGEAEKPFKSSYYYAHNQHRKAGGYADGLKAEDYEMNKPKLLKKTSSTVDTSGVTSAAQAATTLGKGNSIPINRYLWDDDGNDKGIAKIYIDTLPGKTSTDTTPWSDANITKEDVIGKVVGVWKNALIVQIRSAETRYHLFVPRMFGEVEEVKCVVKAKKLIIKLTKKQNTENLKAWPQLPSKDLKSLKSDGVDYVNEDLFSQE